jgi:hypothetical protein
MNSPDVIGIRPAATATAAASPAGPSRRSRVARLDPSRVPGLDTVGDLLKVSADELRWAREILTLLGDPGRRTILERLSRSPQKPGAALPGVTGMDGADIYHRLRSLRWGRVLTRDRHQIYRVDPASLECARKYFDVLIVVGARTAWSLPDDH